MVNNQIQIKCRNIWNYKPRCNKVIWLCSMLRVKLWSMTPLPILSRISIRKGSRHILRGNDILSPSIKEKLKFYKPKSTSSMLSWWASSKWWRLRNPGSSSWFLRSTRDSTISPKSNRLNKLMRMKTQTKITIIYFQCQFGRSVMKKWSKSRPTSLQTRSFWKLMRIWSKLICGCKI